MTDHAPAAPKTASPILPVYRSMLRIRLFEEAVAGMLERDPASIRCPVHLYTGQEAVAAGVCAHLRPDDYVFSTHRSHGHFLAKGGAMKALAAELLGRETGCSRGRGGSMHLADPAHGLPGSSAIVAGTIALAAGAALAFQTRKENSVAVAFFGDGATNEGIFYETLNFTALRRLPVVFVCENNLYSTHMPVAECLASTNIVKKAVASGVPGMRLDGNIVSEVMRAAGDAVRRARRGEGPTFLECLTYRWRGHVGPNYDIEKGLRSRKELEAWMAHCPIRELEKTLARRGLLAEADKKRLYRQVEREVSHALQYATKSHLPPPSEVSTHVFGGPPA
jgi:pyruvate dehydrogenase E1 component alpha subunit